VVAHPAEDASHAAGAATSRCSLLPCPPRGRRGPHPTRRPGSATDLPLTTRCRQRRPRPGLLDRRSSRRRPGSHRGLTRSGGQGRPATSTWSPTPPPEHGRRRTRPDGRGRHQTAGHRTGGQQPAGRRTRWTTTPGDRTPDGWTAGSRTPMPDGWTPPAGHRRPTPWRACWPCRSRRPRPTWRYRLEAPAGKPSSGEQQPGPLSSKDAEGTHAAMDGAWPPPRPSAAGGTPPSSWRLGALLSSDDYGSSVERTATLHPLWQAHVQRSDKVVGRGSDSWCAVCWRRRQSEVP
jgi:hypothetical protein